MTNQEKLQELKELTEQIKEFPPITKVEIGGDEQPVCHYRLAEGETKAYNIFLNGKHICVDHWEASAGAEFPWHAHNEKEWIIVYEGYGRVFYKDGSVADLVSGESVYHDAFVEHRAEIYNDIKFVTVVIPASPDFPGSKVEVRNG